MRDKISSLLLTAALAYEIQTRFFEKPLFCFEERRVQVLEDTHKELMEGSQLSPNIPCCR
jgi:hypothetical protein